MADNVQPTRKKRRIRPSSTETVRERNEKAQKDFDTNPKRQNKSGLRSLVGGFMAPLKFLSKPFKWLGRHLIPKYFRNSYKELRLVTWPSFKKSRQLTTAVVIFAVVFAIFISVVDLILDKIFKRILLK